MDLRQKIDQSVRRQLAQIMKSADQNNVKYELLDKLQLGVMEHHPDGLLAEVLQEIGDAQFQCLYPEGGIAQR